MKYIKFIVVIAVLFTLYMFFFQPPKCKVLYAPTLTDQQNSFYTFASDFQHSACVKSDKPIDSLNRYKLTEISGIVSDLDTYPRQCMVQNEDYIFFHTSNSIVKINKKTHRVLQVPRKPELLETKEQKKWYGNLTYSHELDVLIDFYDQGDESFISIMNADTLEEIQSIPGRVLKSSFLEKGALVWNNKVVYADYDDFKGPLKILTVGEIPKTLDLFPTPIHVCDIVLQDDFLYVVTQTHGRSSAQNSLLCFNLLKEEVQWEFKYDECSTRNTWMSYPICTPKGILFIQMHDIHVNGGTVKIDFFNLKDGTILWSTSLPEQLRFGLINNSPNSVTANEEQICLNVKEYDPLKKGFSTQIIVLSTQDGVIESKFNLSHDIESIFQVNETLVLTARDCKWIGVMDTKDGKMIVSRDMKEGSLLSNTIFEGNKSWCLVINEEKKRFLLQMINSKN